MSESLSQPHLKSPYPWQYPQWSRLDQNVAGERLAHAIILTGPKGIGKQVFITAFGQRLLCLQPKEGACCGVCKGCQLNSASTHPDLKMVLPEEEGKAIKIDQIRELQGFVANTAQQGGRKIVVLGPVESLNINSANALLKTLEEPSLNTHLLMYSHQLSSVLPTVRSRAQIIQMSIPKQSKSLEWLANFTDIDVRQLLEMANGSPLHALSLCDADVFEEKALLDQLIGKVYCGEFAAVAAVSKLLKSDLASVLHCLLTHIDRNVKELMQQIERGNKRRSVQKLFEVRDQTLQLSRQIQAGANPNKQLALEELMLLYRRSAN